MCILYLNAKFRKYMKWLHNLLKGMSLTAALFVFQACYGTPDGFETGDIDMGDNPAPVEIAAEPNLPPVVALLPEEPEVDPMPEAEE